MTGTQIAYYYLCKRKLWLFTHKIDMEQNNENVSMGKFISETTYQREKHEIKIDDIVLDYYDAKNKIIHEVKKSDKMEEVHTWQVKHYISVLESKGITGVKGEINYPKLKQRVEIELTDNDRAELKKIREEIKTILAQEQIPPVIDKPFCKNCAYYELCYI